MLTWQLDRLLRLGPLFAVLTGLIPAAIAALVSQASSAEDILPVLLVASIVMFLGSMFGTTALTALGAGLFGFMSVVAAVSAVVLTVVGAGLLLVLVIQDTSGLLRRSPQFNADVLIIRIQTITAVAFLGALLFGLAYVVATLATWQTIVFPFGIVAIGFAARTAIDAHAKNVQSHR